MKIEEAVRRQKAFFRTGKTMPTSFRKMALKRLRRAILCHEKEICAALREDLNKSESESYLTEIGMTLSELNYMEKHLPRWAAKHPVLTPLAQFSAESFTVKEPYGTVLVMSPWNYPFMLCMEPLIGALAAGNCCVVKPSAYAPATSAAIRKILGECFPPEYVLTVEGGRKENQALLDQPFDYIFFTGGVAVGREVMERAAKNLTPVTLELGGKSPCIVDRTAKLDLAAKRIVFGKFLNCGQTCVAPDYILAERCIKEEFIGYLKKWITVMYGADARKNPDYGKMINEKHFRRVCGLIDPEKTVFGGGADADTLKIQPTILDNVTAGDAVMQEEIFGPVLPVLGFDTLPEAERFIRERPKPLALYLFTRDRRVMRRFLRHVPFGGGCINDTVIHLATSRMGFGGVGQSGMGSYHGKKSFDTFSHEKSIVKKHLWLDLPMRYAPYAGWKDALVRMFLR